MQQKELFESNEDLMLPQQLPLDRSESYFYNFIYGTFIVTLGKGVYRKYLMSQMFIIRASIMAPSSIISYYLFCNLMNQRNPIEGLDKYFGTLLATKTVMLAIAETHSVYIRQNIQKGIDLANKGKIHVTLQRRIQFFGILDLMLRTSWVFLLNSLYNDRKVTD